MCTPVPVAPGRFKQEKAFSASEVFLVSLALLAVCAVLGLTCLVVYEGVQMDKRAAEIRAAENEMYPALKTIEGGWARANYIHCAGNNLCKLNPDFSVIHAEGCSRRIGRNTRGPRVGFGFGQKITGGIGWGFTFQ